YASRNWLAGTTSSLAGTAVVAPASANRFQLRITLGEMSSSRLSSASVLDTLRAHEDRPRLQVVRAPGRVDLLRFVRVLIRPWQRVPQGLNVLTGPADTFKMCGAFLSRP